VELVANPLSFRRRSGGKHFGQSAIHPFDEKSNLQVNGGGEKLSQVPHWLGGFIPLELIARIPWAMAVF
jgi:hypothetical protein